MRAALPFALIVSGFGTIGPQPAHAERLSHDVVPTFQAIELSLDADHTTYDGRVRIELDVREPTNQFRFHWLGDSLLSVVLARGGEVVPVTHGTEEWGVVRVEAARALRPGPHELLIEFTNAFDTRANSLFRMEVDGRAYVVSDFEPARAREAFPCWDEPEFKIPFQLTLKVPAGHIALSNTLIESESTEGGLTTVVFKRTPPLPTYLVAMATGPWETTPIKGLAVPARLVTVAGANPASDPAMNMAPRLLRALETYFGRAYPYEKLDLIAVPLMTWAMENPGAITFPDDALLVPEEAAAADRRASAFLLAHELAHMWFGDLVTLAWWDELWLKEAFSNWLAAKVVDDVYPEFNAQELARPAIERVSRSDAELSARTVSRPVVSDADFATLYDGFVYTKGAAVLMMFEGWLSEEVFRRGVRDYVAAHAGKAATADDFWQALGAAAGRDVTTPMKSFLDQPGIPLVRVELRGDGSLRLRQKRFLPSGATAPESSLWHLPVALKLGDGKHVEVRTIMLNERERIIQPEVGFKASWVHPNAAARGYYRWAVDASSLEELLSAGAGSLEPEERENAILNAFALLQAGAMSGSEYLGALARAADDSATSVLGHVVTAIDDVWGTFGGELDEPLAAYVRELLGPRLRRVGFFPTAGEAMEVTELRPRLMRGLALLGRDAEVLDSMEKLAASYLEDSSSVDPSMVGMALRLSCVRGNREWFERLRDRFESSGSPTERRDVLGALGFFSDESLQEEALRYSIEGPLRPWEMFQIPRAIQALQPERRARVWQWFESNYDSIAARFPRDDQASFTFMARGCSLEILEAAQRFFADPGHSPPGTRENLEQVADAVRACVSLREREVESVRQYLSRYTAEH